MKNSKQLFVCSALCVLIAACGSSDTQRNPVDAGDTQNEDTATDTGEDAVEDTDEDSTLDTDEDVEDVPDVRPDGDPPPDVGEDTGVSEPWRDCSDFGYCQLMEPGCCGGCGELTLDDLEPVGLGNRDVIFDATCMDDDPICPGCASMPIAPNFIALCEDNVCNEYDVETSRHTECETASDCMVIWSDCCGCGPDSLAIAVEYRGEYTNAVCDPRADCLACPAVDPEGTPACVDNRCVIQ